MAYGLTLDQVILLRKEINAAVRELKKLELENSELITKTEGDQYFQLRPFPKDGSSVRKQLMAILEQQLAGFSDDRIMLLRSAIDDSNAFKNFGRNSKQIWFEEVVNSNGTKEWQLHEKSVTDKMTVDRSSAKNRSSASKKLLDDLIQRHLPK